MTSLEFENIDEFARRINLEARRLADSADARRIAAMSVLTEATKHLASTQKGPDTSVDRSAAAIRDKAISKANADFQKANQAYSEATRVATAIASQLPILAMSIEKALVDYAALEHQLSKPYVDIEQIEAKAASIKQAACSLTNDAKAVYEAVPKGDGTKLKSEVSKFETFLVRPWFTRSRSDDGNNLPSIPLALTASTSAALLALSHGSNNATSIWCIAAVALACSSVLVPSLILLLRRSERSRRRRISHLLGDEVHAWLFFGIFAAVSLAVGLYLTHKSDPLRTAVYAALLPPTKHYVSMAILLGSVTMAGLTPVLSAILDNPRLHAMNLAGAFAAAGGSAFIALVGLPNLTASDVPLGISEREVALVGSSSVRNYLAEHISLNSHSVALTSDGRARTYRFWDIDGSSNAGLDVMSSSARHGRRVELVSKLPVVGMYSGPLAIDKLPSALDSDTVDTSYLAVPVAELPIEIWINRAESSMDSKLQKVVNSIKDGALTARETIKSLCAVGPKIFVPPFNEGGGTVRWILRVSDRKRSWLPDEYKAEYDKLVTGNCSEAIDHLRFSLDLQVLEDPSRKDQVHMVFGTSLVYAGKPRPNPSNFTRLTSTTTQTYYLVFRVPPLTSQESSTHRNPGPQRCYAETAEVKNAAICTLLSVTGTSYGMFTGLAGSQGDKPAWTVQWGQQGDDTSCTVAWALEGTSKILRIEPAGPTGEVTACPNSGT